MSFKECTEVKLVELCDLISRGITPSYTEDKEEGIIVLNQKCIRDNRVNLELARLTNPNKKKVTENKLLKQYDILVNSTGVGTLGRVAQIKKIDVKMTVDSHVTIVRPKKEINPIFLGYNLFMNQRYIEYLGEGSTGQTELSRIRLGEALKIKVPSLEEQKKIAKVLSDLDKKIEVNNKINKNLEKMAQVIFKHWFIDFEFPNENGEPYKSSGGEMIESELGMIPKGWNVVELEDITTVNRRGFSPKYSENGIKIINQRCVRNHNLVDEAIQYHDLSLKKVPDEVYLKPKDILINSMGVGTLGRVAQRSLVKEKAIVHSCITIIRADETKIDPYILGRYFISIENELEQMGIGTTGQTSLNNKSLAKRKLILPDMEIQKKISKLLMNISVKIDSNLQENEVLAKTRNIILPKLMSGEIKVYLNSEE